MRMAVRRLAPPAAVAVGLCAVALAAGGGGFSGGPAPARPPGEGELAGATPTPERPPPPPPGTGDADAPLLIEVAVSAVLIAFLVSALLLLLYAVYLGLRTLLVERVVRRPLTTQAPSQPADADREADEVRRAVRAVLEDLDAGGDARRAVIACWLALERIAARVGTARMVADTPADLVTRLLTRHHVSAAALERLARAYRRARYAPARVDASLVAEAADALREIDRQLTLFTRPAAAAPSAAAGSAPSGPAGGGRR